MDKYSKKVIVEDTRKRSNEIGVLGKVIGWVGVLSGGIISYLSVKREVNYDAGYHYQTSEIVTNWIMLGVGIGIVLNSLVIMYFCLSKESELNIMTMDFEDNNKF
jgi:hypothetical protein